MSTRACIARKTATGFSGVYHHWDGYPEGLGASLFELYRAHFKGNLDAMLAFLIDAHPAGWSTINGADFDSPAGFENGKGPACYCHGTRHEKAQVLTHENASDSGCEYAYVFDGDTMYVLSSTYKNGCKMIGMFGCGAPGSDVYWKQIGKVALTGRKPRFDRMHG